MILSSFIWLERYDKLEWMMGALSDVLRCLLFIGIAAKINCQTSACTCDLTAIKCDVNCCCDPDCAVQDQNAFTKCAEADLRIDNRVCVSDKLLYVNNVAFEAQTTGSGLLCIFRDNNEGRNFYTDVTVASSSREFDKLTSEYDKQSFSRDDYQDSIVTSSSDTYKVGDAIPIIFETNYVGRMTIPAPAASQHCNDRNPIGFLQEQTSSCSRTLKQLQTQCVSDRSLSAVSYFSGFKVAPNPTSFSEPMDLTLTNETISNATSIVPDTTMASVLSSISDTIVTTSIVEQTPITSSIMSSVASPATQDITSTQSIEAPTTQTSVLSATDEIVYIDYNNDSLVVPSLTVPVLCLQSSDGTTGACPFVQPPLPTYDNVNGICQNVVLKVSYIITYSTNARVSISDVTAQFTLGNIRKDTQLIRQSFSVKFTKKEATSSQSIPRSGNPGYVIGKPVIAGHLQVNTQLNSQAIVIDKDPLKWFTVIRPSVTGTCDKAQSDPIRFGINARSACHVRIKQSMSTQECSLLQSVINETLLGTLPTHVATYGNSLVTNTADWVNVLVPSSTLTPSASAGQCTGMVIGIHIEILHAKTGFLGLPQEKIVGVRIKFDTPKTLVYRCFGRFCKSDLTLEQNVEVVQSVAFIDVSTTAEAKLKPKPNFEAKAPSDFFYPF